jgi:solute carrier family 25 (mitochondrial dicarboxylate transporter), member 10
VQCILKKIKKRVGSPSDLINIRMQADSRLPVENRRNYKNVFDGGYKIIKNEGFLSLWKGKNKINKKLKVFNQILFFSIFFIL